MKKLLGLVSLMLLLGSMVFATAVDEEYPTRDITNVLVWGAGGGTDTCNRVVMAEMAKILGVNIQVQNVTGGVAGSNGMAEAYSRAADGYTICGLSESCVTAAVMGGFPERVNVWDYFIIGGSPDLISVTPDSDIQTLEDLIAAAKAAPGEIASGASGAGSIHHLNLLAFEKGAGIDLNFIPYDGSAPAQTAAMTGEIELVITSAAEQAQLIRGGKLRPLAMLIPDSFAIGDITVPSAWDTVNLDAFLPIGQAIGFAVKQDVPEEIKTVLRDAFAQAMQTEAVKKFGQDNYYVLSGLVGEEAGKVFDSLEANFGWTLADLGSAVVDPASLGIPRP